MEWPFGETVKELLLKNQHCSGMPFLQKKTAAIGQRFKKVETES
jgi:hypothetical protein